MAVGFCHTNMPIMMNLNMITMFAVLILSQMLSAGQRQMATEASAGLAVLTIIIVCLKQINIYGLMAAALYILSGKFIGSDGKMSIFLRIDVLHIVLAIANVLFTWAVLNL